ncbi:3-[(3aS,4S,7aS)-7a-methyl-1,5-dioxo-octahydro-1H-inden-4-yl]propanoyl:CoA ligase-like [Babylonia areolata]|uniref:3-[(3aS,4S,7aS)-7a-methyl-1, 5-dioxo-octahydro-1H-inden-4-yl]propanoyl:CoA ligase-like n=1 Tax=Babylonia areolata TaxID=304850 RepID=UPI003FD1A76E
MASTMPKIETLPGLLQHWAQEKPDSAAFIFRDKNQQRNVLTWATLYTLAGRFAADLRNKGIEKQHLVINTLPNSPERVVCEAGIWMAGAVSVNGQCVMTDGSDLLNTITQSRAPAILVDPDVTGSPWSVLKNHVVLDDGEHVTSSKLACLKMVIFVRRVENEEKGDFIGQLKSQKEWFQAKDVKPEDVFSVFTTSGSTGFSKLVIRTQGPFIKYLVGTFKKILEESGTVGKSQLSIAPMGWVGGSLVYNVAPGATRVTCDMRAGNPDDMAQFLWNCIQEEKCNIAILSPTYLPKLAEIADMTCSPHQLDSMMLGGLPIQQSMVNKGLKMAQNICVSYGASDFGVVAAVVVPYKHTFTDHDSGQPFADVEVKIVSLKDESMPCATGQVGHILFKGPNMMKGYLNNPKATADAYTEDGFFRTGDLGRLDERGHLIVDGRGSDAIMRGVYIFYPTWIENRLRECPAVADVVIVGVPDADVNEELCACVVLKSDDVSIQQVRKFAEGIFVSKDDPLSACPRYFLRFESLPETDTGKPQRKVIKTQAAQQLGLITASD